MGPETDALTALFADLAEAPHRYDFYRAMRRLECLNAGNPRWGGALKPSEEPIRLGQEPSLSFAPSPLASFRLPTDRQPPRLRVHLFGLLGPNGPLPIHLTEYVRDRERNHADKTMGDFLDMLQHRFLALFYRAWAQAQPHVNRDRENDDRFTMFVGAFLGIAPEPFRNRDSVPDLAKLFHAGTLIRQVRNAEGLGTILRHFFDIPVKVHEFIGQWTTLGREERTRLSMTGAELGAGAVIGGAVWDRQHKFRLEIGPLTLRQYEAFLPGGRQLESLVAWVRTYLSFELDWDVRLVLEEAHVPSLSLGRSGRLGWTTWLGRRAGGDAGDLCLDAESLGVRAGVRVA